MHALYKIVQANSALMDCVVMSLDGDCKNDTNYYDHGCLATYILLRYLSIVKLPTYIRSYN